VLEHPVQWRGNTFGIIAQVAEVVADKAELCLLRVYLFNAANPFNGLVLENIATQPVDGIGGVNDHSAAHQAVYYGLYLPHGRVLRVYS
jgi:hypothetical protein